MAQMLRTLAILLEDLVQLPASTWLLKTVTPASGDPMPSFGFHGHCMYMPGKTTHTHKIKNKISKKIMFSMLVKRKHDFLK